jgi:hypothetical protein
MVGPGAYLVDPRRRYRYAVIEPDGSAEVLDGTLR